MLLGTALGINLVRGSGNTFLKSPHSMIGTAEPVPCSCLIFATEGSLLKTRWRRRESINILLDQIVRVSHESLSEKEDRRVAQNEP